MKHIVLFLLEAMILCRAIDAKANGRMEEVIWLYIIAGLWLIVWIVLIHKKPKRENEIGTNCIKRNSKTVM